LIPNYKEIYKEIIFREFNKKGMSEKEKKRKIMNTQYQQKQNFPKKKFH